MLTHSLIWEALIFDHTVKNKKVGKDLKFFLNSGRDHISVVISSLCAAESSVTSQV